MHLMLCRFHAVFCSFFNLTESPEDYKSLLLTLEFDSCVNQSCVNITINEDFKDEMTETFLAVVGNVSDSRIDLEPDTVEIHITDNDGELHAVIFRH